MLQVAINTNITDLNEFLDHIIRHTNMTCLTAPGDTGAVGARPLALHCMLLHGCCLISSVCVCVMTFAAERTSGHIACF